jgi:heme/copper-type cytochrome/quinol oxidase subunit 2
MKLSNVLTVRQMTLIAFLFVAFVAAGATMDFLDSPTNIFAPASTPAKSITHLSVLVLAITGIIFAVVFTLLVYAVLKSAFELWMRAANPLRSTGAHRLSWPGR